MSVAVGARIRSVRKARGTTQVELAEASSLKQSFVSRVEAGVQNLELRTLARIAHALDTTMEELVAGVEVDPSRLRKRGMKAGEA